MPRQSTRETLIRQWEMLALIPEKGAGITAAELVQRLADKGYGVSKRVVEKDLRQLEPVVGLHCNDKSIPYGWRWQERGAMRLPVMGVFEAVSLHLIHNQLRQVLPASILASVKRDYEQGSQRIKAEQRSNSHAQLATRILNVPQTVAMGIPAIPSGVLEEVYQALLDGCQLQVRYRSLVDGEEGRDLRLHPLGLVQRGAVVYLVATAFEYSDPRLYALHRVLSARGCLEAAVEPPGFSLQTFVDHQMMSYGGTIKLVARVQAELAGLLRETPLGDDQQLLPEGECYRLQVSLGDSWPLQGWILSQGRNIEVLEPAELRERVAEELRAAADHYGVRRDAYEQE